MCKLIHAFRFRLLEFVVLEEVDQVSLMWLQHLLASKLVHTQLLDYLQDVHFFAKLALSILEKEIVSILLGTTAQAVRLFKAPQRPEATILVRKGLSLLYLFFDLRFFVAVCYLVVVLIYLLGKSLCRFAFLFSVQWSDILVLHVFVIILLLSRVELLDQTVG